VKPQANGGAIVLVEDERNLAAMSLVPSLSTVMAVARVLNAHRVIEVKYAGKGEVRYAAGPQLPDFLVDAVTRAGAASCDRNGDNVRVPAARAAVAAIVDQAFASLAYHLRSSVGATDLAGALRTHEGRRKKAVIDREQNSAQYWTAVLELSALAGEISRPRGGRWIDTKDMPVPFAIKFPEGQLAMPAKLAIQIIDGTAEESLATSDVADPAPT
jgi:hypothetical protein